MSILNVNQIQPVGSGQTVTITAADISASSSTITANTFTGNLTGNVTGNVTGNLTGNVTSSSTSTFSSGLNVTGGSVGIGTDNPSYSALHISGSPYYGATLRLTNTGTSGGDYFILSSDSSWTAGGDKLLIGRGTPATSNTKIVLDSSGNIGIGLTNPTSLLTLRDLSAADESLLRIEAYRPGIRFIDVNNSTTDGEIIVNDGSLKIGLSVESSESTLLDEKFRITGGGNVQIANGNLVFSTSGTGIDFSAASGSAAGSTSAVLDDYEEGTFTPRISVEGQGSDAAIDNVSGTYVRVGQLVHCTFNADLNGIPAGRGTSFAWQWGGLPFSSLAEGSDGSEDYIGSVRVAAADHTSTYGVASEFILRLFDNNTGGRIEAMRVSNGDVVNASLWMKDNTVITGSITYRAL